MQIVLPGALPDPREARELAQYLPKTAPTLFTWLSHAKPHRLAADPVHSGCVPHEKWQLMARGFKPDAGQNFATGLGPLWAGQVSDSDKPVWLVELVHVAPSRDGAALIPASELAITPEQSVALFESVQPFFEEDGFALQPCDTNRWRIQPPSGHSAPVASPMLVSLSSVNEWWSQDAASRPWRRLANEVQMRWFDHPVNLARQQQGLPAINSLWLFGGARASQLHHAAPANVNIYTDLLGPLVRQDWNGWITALAQLEAQVFAPLAGQPPRQIIMTGRDAIIELTPGARRLWAQWLPGSKEAWRKWWSPQN
ncbi:hypothetical protein H0A71_08685 [Alcaligenaceae bacterium]|nr:hypothetical protein [Alcaligenaceae bacterium]